MTTSNTVRDNLKTARQAHAAHPTPATMAAVHTAELADALQRVGR